MRRHRSHIPLPHVRELTFWHFQTAGWLLLWSSDLAMILMRSPRPLPEFLIESLEVPIGFVLSLLLRQVYRRVRYRELGLVPLLLYVLTWSFIFTALFYSGIVLMWHGLGYASYAHNLLYYKVSIQWVNRFLPIWIGWSALYFGIRYWRDWEGEKERARQAQSLAQRARLEMLRYQVNPHFLFNVLNSVRSLIEEDAGTAKAMIGDLRAYLEDALTGPGVDVRPLNEEVDILRLYLAIEQKRFEEKLEVRIDVDPGAESFPVPSFLLHPLVENAVKYGMNTSPMPLRITLHASQESDRLRVVITNSGRWVPPESDRASGSTGTGLANVRARLNSMYPDRHLLEMRTDDECVSMILEIRRDESGR